MSRSKQYWPVNHHMLRGHTCTSRQKYLQATVSLLAKVYESEVSDDVLPEKQACITVQPLLLECLEDYTTDKRGDVGSLCAPLAVQRGPYSLSHTHARMHAHWL